MLETLLVLIADSIVHFIVTIVGISLIIPGMFMAQAVLQRLKMRTRRRLPFGILGALAAAGAIFFAIRWLPAIGASALRFDIDRAWEEPLNTLIQLAWLNIVLGGIMAQLAIAANLFHVWWSSRRVTANAILDRDKRAPVLLLRSFEGDEWEAGLSRATEIALARVVSRELGPLVGLGSPQDFMPPRGANREYVANADWQQHVDAYTHRATAVIFLITQWTKAVQWEFELVRQRFDASRVLVILPGETKYNSGRYRWRETVLQEIGVAVTGERSLSEASDGLAVGFTREWNPSIIKSTKDRDELAQFTVDRLTVATPDRRKSTG